jgi:hypothetical protein
MLARYQGEPAAFVGAFGYRLAPHLERPPADHPDRRRVETVCQPALEVRRLTGGDLTRGNRDSRRSNSSLYRHAAGERFGDRGIAGIGHE